MGIFSIFSKKDKTVEKADLDIKKSVTDEGKNTEKTSVQTTLEPSKNLGVSDTAENKACADSAVLPAEKDVKTVEEPAAKSVESENKPELKQDTAVEDTAPVKEEKKPTETEVEVKKSFFERLRRTRQNLSYGISALVKGRKIDEELYEDLETALLTADLGVETTNFIIEKLKKESKLRELHDAEALRNNLKEILKEILLPCSTPLKVENHEDRPYVILMIGVNGAGKTTTIGKLAQKYKDDGHKVMLAAGDTFRAAAVEQLKEWGNRTGTPVISQPTGSDSASVIYDALSSAKAHHADILICDTAGRLQNKDHLMEELKKIVRVMKKHSESVPDEVMLVLDASTGQNAMSQMKLFSEAVSVTGLTITKLDGTAKGGIVFAIADKYKTPVRYVGIGEKVSDLRIFDVDNFVDALFD
ncbi:MAG: signal recognition particle-docking protein FtsY [Succinivibrio sp.]